MNFERHQLDNGLRVLSASMPQVQSVTCMIMLAAGSRYETPETNGIAHFAEHMFFKGTERRPTARDIGMEVDGLGGEFNAFTGKEYTGYYVRCAADYRDQALDVLADMLRNSKFEPEEIDREKGVIIEEMNMYFDTPRDFISGVYEELLYGDQPLGWDIIGRKETVRGAKRETFLDYTGRWYKPERMVVGVAGKLDGDYLGSVERLLGDLEPAETGDPPPASVNGAGPQVKIHRKDSDQAHLCLGVHSYPLVHPDRWALQLLAAVLGTGMSSRLFTEVRERRGLAYYVYAHNQTYTDVGSLYSQAGVDIKRSEEAVETIVEQFRKIADEPVPAEELEKARALAKGRFVLRLESPQGMIVYGLGREVLNDPAIEPEEVLAGLDAVTAEDIQRVAQDVIASNALKLALIGPFDDAKPFEALVASG
ncbi:MAG: insulinase family protein [Actinobacteria bacterium]|nr:MAG: insulinase family protein [Actinomycetota bacterium]